MSFRVFPRLVVALAVLALAQPVFAHEQVGVAGGLASGLLHPLTGMDHLIAMVAVGIWGAQLGAPAIWVLPITFPLVMAIGGVLGVLRIPLPIPGAEPRCRRMKYRLAGTSIATAMLVASAQAADAHIVASRLGDFYTGALHPLTDLQDLILWGAMGVLAGSLGGSKGRWLVLAFPLGLLAGLVMQRASGLDSPGPAANAGMILVLGLLLASAARIPTAMLCVIAFGLAVMRGAANAGDVGPDTNRLLFAAGLAWVGYAAITLTMAVTLAFRQPEPGVSMAWRGIAIRACGGWIAAIGLMMVGLAFAS